jgi:hydroxymethylpyrimidine/phosphomethylpyrimidine kinase
MAHTLPRVLTIAGSDSGGGAGIQADLKTFQALGVYGMSAITALTAQNTLGVRGIHDIPPDFVALQIDAVAEDIGVDAAKTGMLASAAIIEAVADSIQRNRIEKLVVDPVMIAKSGDALLQDTAREAMSRLMLPLALVLTPNVPEAEALTGRTIDDDASIEAALKALHALGPRWILLKGGHFASDEATDFLYDGAHIHTFSGPRIATKNTHGTGCTYASAIAAEIALGHEIPDAVHLAKAYLTQAIRENLDLGHGHGPLHHGWPLK